MLSTKKIKGLSFNLAHSFFSTLNFYEKGYMCDWIVNSAIQLNINEIEIDILNKAVTPPQMEIEPILIRLDFTGEKIASYLNNVNLAEDSILEARFIINVKNNRIMVCNTYLKDINNKIYESKDYVEQSFIDFKVFK